MANTLIIVILAWSLSAACCLCAYNGQDKMKSKSLLALALMLGPIAVLTGYVVFMWYVIFTESAAIIQQAVMPPADKT